MTMKCLRCLLFIISLITAGLIFVSYHAQNIYASSTEAAHGGHAAESAHGAGHDGYPGEVPFDRPVEEIKKFIAPMNELNIFPCSDCHDAAWEPNYERRELGEPHDVVPEKFINHDSENRWCLDCHSAKTRDKFQLLNGKLVEFNEYYRVCEQCHKRVYREWKMGIHGKRTGYWNGEKQWMHCTQCHDPHNPPFKAIKPEPVPRTPLNVRTSSSGEEHQSSAETKH